MQKANRNTSSEFFDGTDGSAATVAIFVPEQAMTSLRRLPYSMSESKFNSNPAIGIITTDLEGCFRFFMNDDP